MLIVFANQKGGCGKSTNCIQLANYLSKKDKKKEVIVVDADFQKSISDRRKDEQNSLTHLKEEELSIDNKYSYTIESVEKEDIPLFLQEVKRISDDYHILVDLPGRIDDSMEGVFREADVLIIPFQYDRMTLDSTSIFIAVMNKLNVKAKMVFLPNRIKTNVRYDTMMEVNDILGQYGVVAPIVADRIAMERISTLGISSEAEKIVDESYRPPS